ncbi:unnamed protein product [Coregonus sp. 'balchen']|nr:unnamed protein product [Coregonus sp. 'balchen']
MFKKKDSNTVKVSSKTSKPTTNDLALVIARMQSNSDQVEKDILRAEELLAVDAESEKKNLPLQHQKVVANNLSEAEGLLNDLFLDVDKAKKYKHPQGSEIESDVKHLHDRWLKDCAFYRDIYEPVNDVELMPRIDWASVLNQKQREVNTEEYGPTMADLKKQIAAHNILHKEIEAYSSQLSTSSTSTKEEYAAIKKQYNNLLDNSKWRHHYLSSLYDYMQGCNKELAYLGDEQDKILKQDWSDHMLDPPDVRRQYENFKNNSLLSHESEVNKLQDDGDRLIELKHPASTTIQAQRDALRNEWQKFLNLCICQETHLDYVEDFKKYQLDVETLSESLSELNSSLKKVEGITGRSGSAMTLQLEAEESTVQRNEQLLADLRKRSTTIAPLKLRRYPPTRSTTVESLCDWKTEKAELTRGDKFTLKSNSDVENWDVLNSSGATKSFPGVCFLIPPPDPEAIATVDLHGDVLDDIKKRRAVYLGTMKDKIRCVEERPVYTAPPSNPKAKAVAGQLDKLDEDLVKAKQDMLSRLRAPLDRSDPTTDLAKRLKEQESLRKDVAGSQDELKKLGQEPGDQPAAVATRSTAQTSIGQGTQVKQLQNRYSNVNNQLKEREGLLQEAAGKNQEFQNTSKSLNYFLKNLPDNKISPSDDLSQVNSKQTSQKRVVDDIKRKGDDLDRVVDLSQDLQNILNEYEVNTDKYSSTLDNVGAKDAKKPHTSTLADTVQNQEKALVNHYAKTSAENDQLLSQMGFAKNLIAQKHEKQSIEPTIKPTINIKSLQQELSAEHDRRSRAETDVETFKTRMLSLKSRKGMYRVEEKEVLEYYRDPKLETDLKDLEDQIHKEALKRSRTQGEIEGVKSKIATVGGDLKCIKPKLVTREVTEFERDPQLDVEASKLKDEIGKIKDEVRVKEGEVIQQKTEVTILNATRPNIREKVMKKEVIRLEKDPEMLKAVKTFEKEIADEGNKSKTLNDEIFQTRSQINALERIIPTIQPKVVTREVKKVEQDPELINESKRLRSGLEEEKIETDSLVREVSQLKSRYSEVGQWKSKVELKEIVNEIYRIDPQTELEIMRLKKDVQDLNKQRSDLQDQITLVMVDLEALRSKKPKVELKEVIQDVVKEERSPENEREIQRLNDQVNHLHRTYNNVEDQINLLRKERDEWKAEKSKVETKLMTKDVFKYEDDPLLEKEADRLRKEVREEQQRRRTTEEMVFDLQNKYILLERQKPEEKVVVQEVVRLQKDPKQIVEHDKLGRSLDEEVKSRRQLELEMQKLKTLVEEKESILKQSDEHQKKIKVESELKQIKLRIKELENAPPPVEESIVVEEVLKVERDPKLERMTNSLRSDMDKETNDREKAIEKTVYKEVIRVEKDQAVEAERYRLKSLVSQEKHARQDLEEKIEQLSDKLNRLNGTQSSTSREETSLILARDTLQREKDNLTRELKKLESERQDISLSFQQQTKLMSERSQINRQKSVKMESDVQRLEREILDEKDTIHQKDNTIRELQRDKEKEDHTETRKKGDQREKEKQPKFNSITSKTASSLKSSPTSSAPVPALAPKEIYPIAGVIDTNTDTCFSIRSAVARKMIESGTAQKLLEAQAATGGIVDISNKERYSVHNAAERGLIDSSQLQRLLNAQKAYTGVEDPMTRERLSVGEAVLKGWMPKETALRYMEVQHLTGGLVNPNNTDRVGIQEAIGAKMIDSTMMRELLAEYNYAKEIVDPTTNDKINYKQAMARCKTDPLSGLLMLPASSKVSDSSYTPTYNSHRFSSR